MSSDTITVLGKLLYPVDGRYIDDADKDELESWTELERENELASRHEVLLKEWQGLCLRAVNLRKQSASTTGHTTSTRATQDPLRSTIGLDGAFRSLEERLARIEEIHGRIMGLVKADLTSRNSRKVNGSSRTSLGEVLSLMQAFYASLREVKQEILEVRQAGTSRMLRDQEQSPEAPPALPTSDSDTANPEYQIGTRLAPKIGSRAPVHPAPLEHQGIKYRWDPAGEGFQVLVLLPTLEQYADLKNQIKPGRPALFSCADALGAKEHGVFKIVAPSQFQLALPDPTPRSFRRKQKCSRYHVQALGDGYWRTDPYQSTAVFDRSSNKRIEDLRPLLGSQRVLPDVFYLTDCPAGTEREREAAGLPCQSPIETIRGNQLHRTAHAILGIHTITKYEGSAGAPFAWHIDDCRTDAINYLYYGSKEWSVIPPADQEAAEKEFRRLVLSTKASDAHCHQFMRHDAVFGIGRGIERNVAVRSFAQNAGELVFIYGNAYHSGYSKTYTVAEARNYAGDGWNVEGYRFCTTRCCDSPITYEHMRFARNEAGQGCNGDHGGSTEGEDVDAEGDEDLNVEEQDDDAEGDDDTDAEEGDNVDVEEDEDLNAEVEGADAEGDGRGDCMWAGVDRREPRSRRENPTSPTPSTSIPAKKQRVEPDATTLANAVCGKQAFRHLCSLIRAWRAKQRPFFELTSNERAEVQLVRVIEGLSCTGSLLEFLCRLAKSELAKNMDSRKPPDYTYARSTDVDAILKDLGWENTERNKRKLRHFISEGRRWNIVCQDFAVCLIPPNRDQSDSRSPKGVQYQDSGLDIALFRKSLQTDEFNLSIRRMANTFQRAILEQRDVPEFLWESEDAQTLERLSPKQLLPLMECRS
ncbi:hypothetical protein N656DRAFT_561513 [Canariomyces notabilis]|uniref:JmjC domain-containing protein n=1 Tax=Canariomyces notabilis TaxID=2074819 RepID=A0AAN6QF55_9PEZI|nr:hypothetical protein N656DRAFT_561513 [Canariomyces arenarius]